jgi:hypothetical protein
MTDAIMTPEEIDQALVPLDVSTLPRDDPRQDERWSVTLDGIQEGAADILARHLIESGIRCHVRTLSPRVTTGSRVYMEMSGLYEVCVHKEDLQRATALAQRQFPETHEGDVLAHGRLWGPSIVGKEAYVLCQLPYEECWDLAGALVRAGIPAIVLPDDVDTPAPPAHMSFTEATSDIRHDDIEHVMSYLTGRYHPERLIGEPARDYVPVDDRGFSVVVEEPRVKEAAEIAAHLYGDQFHLDGSPYDA